MCKPCKIIVTYLRNQKYHQFTSSERNNYVSWVLPHFDTGRCNNHTQSDPLVQFSKPHCSSKNCPHNIQFVPLCARGDVETPPEIRQS